MSREKIIDLTDEEEQELPREDNLKVNNDDEGTDKNENDVKDKNKNPNVTKTADLPSNIQKQLSLEQSPPLLNPQPSVSTAHSVPIEANVRVRKNEKTPLLVRNSQEASQTFQYPQDPEFSGILNEVECAVEQGVYPERIMQGSSGSYFVKNLAGVCIRLN